MQNVNPTPFTHLHLHTQYSLLDGANRIDRLLARAQELGMTALAATDHGNLFGAIDFYKKATKAGIKPIFGVETYVASTNHLDKSIRKTYHLILLAKNNLGLKNLYKLLSIAFLDGFYYNPRIDKDLLRTYGQGLFGLSSCMGGEIPQFLLAGQFDEAVKAAKTYAQIFEKDSFYLELIDSKLSGQDIVNDGLVRIAKETGLPLVATADCHYLHRADHIAHEILMCISTGKVLSDENRMRQHSSEFFLKSEADMMESFGHIPEAVANSGKIASQCNVTLSLGKVYLPDYEVPEGNTKESFLARVSSEGLSQKLAAGLIKGDEAIYQKRLASELAVINSMGYAGYFLIVWDFIRFARLNDIPVGPGRGSGAGSLVAYALSITDIDPIPYDLIFERFLNPERVSMPDFDIDFCMKRRDEIIRYVTEKYGKDHVAQIITYGTLRARGVIRDVGRVLDIPYSEVDKIAKLVPEVLDITLEKALEIEPELGKLMTEDERIKNLIEYALKLEGLNRHAGMHAAGIVISKEPLTEYVPLYRGTGGERITQFAKDEVEDVGLVKFDFLGLKTLTVIHHACALINKNRGPSDSLDIRTISLDDATVYSMIGSGETYGVFQLESSGFRDLLKKLKPDCFEDIIAAVALYRPGPLGSGMVEDFCKRKHGVTPIRYPHPGVEDILKETYGIIVYQEQVMRIASKLGGFTLGQADILRRAMGKKKKDVMARQKEKFVKGCSENQVETKVAEEIFDLIEYFAGYGFNKSHSAAYALISYQTAFLKCQYPTEFIAALISCDMENTDKVVRYIEEARRNQIKVLPPDINLSEDDFSIENGHIRFGLGAVKNIGRAAISSIIETRKRQPFKSFMQVCEQIDSRKVNKKVLESLVKCGAFDSIEGVTRRRVIFTSIDQAILQAGSVQRDRESGQLNMFAEFDDFTTGEKVNLASPDSDGPATAWSEIERLKNEREILGFYLSGHPIYKYESLIKRARLALSDEIDNFKHEAKISLLGIIASTRPIVTKTQKKMAILKMEDLHGTVEVVVFPKVYARCVELLETEEPVLIQGSVQKEQDRSKIFAEQLWLVPKVYDEAIERIKIRVDKENISEARLNHFKTITAERKGPAPIVLNILDENYHMDIQVSGNNSVAVSEDLIQQLEGIFPGSQLDLFLKEC